MLAYALGLALVLVGNVLPWFTDQGRPVWGWDVSALWAITGRTSLLRVPPAAAAVVLVAALIMALPVLRARRVVTAVSAGLAATVIGIGVLTLVRGLLLQNPVPPHAGVVATIAGGILLAAGSVALAED